MENAQDHQAIQPLNLENLSSKEFAAKYKYVPEPRQSF